MPTPTKREMIVMIGAKLFREKGYTATSMRELAEQVGMEAASLYNHIDSKEAILKSICFQVGEAYLSHLAEINASQADFREKITHFVRLHIEITVQNIAFVSVANHEWKHLKEPYLSNFLIQRRGYEKHLIRLMEGGIAAKEFKQTNPYVAVLTILSAVRGLEFWQQHKKNISSQVLEDDMVNHLLKGITK